MYIQIHIKTINYKINHLKMALPGSEPQNSMNKKMGFISTPRHASF